MSKVIKGIIWGDEPYTIEAPKPPKTEEEVEEISPEAQEAMLANLKAREERAEAMLQDAKIESEIIKSNVLQEAQTQADEIINQANAEAERIKQLAHDSGYQEGIDDGRQHGEKKVLAEQQHIIDEAVARAAAIEAAARGDLDNYINDCENIVADMAMSIAEKILPQHFIDAPTVILPLVKEAIKKVQDQPKITVRVCQDSYDLLLMARAEFQSMLDGNALLDVEADESLSPGDCIIDSPNGTVDARLQTQLSMVKNAINNVMNK